MFKINESVIWTHGNIKYKAKYRDKLDNEISQIELSGMTVEYFNTKIMYVYTKELTFDKKYKGHLPGWF